MIKNLNLKNNIIKIINIKYIIYINIININNYEHCIKKLQI